MRYRFKGAFSAEEKARIKEAARALDRVCVRGNDQEPRWAFLHVGATPGGYAYWGVRRTDGHMIRAHSVEGLAKGLDTFRKERRRAQRRAAR